MVVKSTFGLRTVGELLLLKERTGHKQEGLAWQPLTPSKNLVKLRPWSEAGKGSIFE